MNLDIIIVSLASVDLTALERCPHLNCPTLNTTSVNSDIVKRVEPNRIACSGLKWKCHIFFFSFYDFTQSPKPMNLWMVLLLQLRSYQNCFRYECDMGRLHGRCCRIFTSHIIVICWRFVSSIAVVVAVTAIVCRARHLKWLSATTKTMTALATAATIYALYRCISLLLRHRRAIKCVTIWAYVRFESFYLELRSAWDSFCLVMK